MYNLKNKTFDSFRFHAVFTKFGEKELKVNSTETSIVNSKLTNYNGFVNSTDVFKTSLFNIHSEFEIDIINRFEQLAAQAKIACITVSSPNIMNSNEAYQEIISMGKEVIPLIIKRLDIEPTLWLMALSKITGENPIPPENRGKINLIVQNWKDWAIKNRYVS